MLAYEESGFVTDPTRIEYDWYHGLTPWNVVEQLLKERGDYLMRCFPQPQITKEPIAGFVLCTRLSLSHSPKNVFKQYLIVRRLNLFYLKDLFKNKELKNQRSKLSQQKDNTAEWGKAFKTIDQLVEYYKKHDIHGEVRLLRSVPRPLWLLNDGEMMCSREQKELGRGNFSVVIKGKYTKRDHGEVDVAIKKLTNDANCEPDKLNILFKEAQMMALFDHPNVIKLHGLFADWLPMQVVIEYCPGGSLVDHLTAYGQEITLKERVLFATEACRGMEYLERHRCIHRDLSARNCLIAVDGVVKISDFGLSQTEDKTTNLLELNNFLPLRWLAPETISRLPVYSHKSDVWSFGMLMYEIFNDGIKPYVEFGDDYKKIRNSIKHGQLPHIPSNTPLEMEEIMRLCWKMNRQERPSFRELRIQLVVAAARNEHLSAPKASQCTTHSLDGISRMEPSEERLEESLIKGPTDDDKHVANQQPDSDDMKKDSGSRERREATPYALLQKKTDTSTSPTPKYASPNARSPAQEHFHHQSRSKPRTSKKRGTKQRGASTTDKQTRESSPLMRQRMSCNDAAIQSKPSGSPKKNRPKTTSRNKE